MAKKAWTIELEDGKHLVELSHKYLSGEKEIRLDGRPLLFRDINSPVDFGGDYPFFIGEHRCAVHIRTNGLTFRYDLSIDGHSAKTGESVDTTEVARHRHFGRVFISVWALVGGALFILFGNGWQVSGIPLRYVGGILVGVGILGLIGPNVFRGGPLDKREDQ
ncbi:MAG TPA: hypothetical protein VF543_12285 [Pyrinomonadaceae bacterium]|jgi:hypothetical protein